ncbi:MAG: hypothetical protein HKL91_07575 [Candidatus Eremiobacteraeota bacterium]|uniref:Uncharacterized protein n=1 Tax=mine drainage metagenome TaxID=410659 RepID=E6PCP8_9ZZZZ|nr:hypothetical protein [Candidatus Eremiobacteraeota bacterium]
MNRSTTIVRSLSLGVAILCAGIVPYARAAAPPSAAEYYRDALAIMQRQPVPPYLTFRTVLSLHGHPPQLTEFRLRTKDGSEISRDLPHGKWEREQGGLDPTWLGVSKLVQYGLDMAQAQSSNAKKPTTPAKAMPHGLKTIAIVTAIAPDDYRISDRGAALCPNGAPGHALHLEALRNKQRRLLTRVVIESATGRFCEMRFSVADSLVAVGVSGYLALHFGESANYWLVHDARFVIGFRTFGLQVSQLTLGVGFRDVTAPATIPAAEFAIPIAGKAKPSPSPSPARNGL